VRDATLDFDRATLTVDYDAAVTSHEALVAKLAEALQQAGYMARPMGTEGAPTEAADKR